MAYVAAGDFREKTVKAWCAGLVLGHDVATDDLLGAIIALVQLRVEALVNDDFEPPNPDSDEIVEVDGRGVSRLYLPRRVRSISAVNTVDATGLLTLALSTAYRVHSSLNAAGTAVKETCQSLDWIDIIGGQTPYVWTFGPRTVQVTGKFGWAAVPDDIKRLTALLVHDYCRSSGGNMGRVVRLETEQATRVFASPSPDRPTGITEADDIITMFQRPRLSYP